MNIRYRDRDPEIPSGGFKPDHRRHRKEAKGRIAQWSARTTSLHVGLLR